MSKFWGRLYVSLLIIAVAINTAGRAVDNPYLWAFVIAHIGCLFFVIKDGVE